jgi:hypothetical protein
MEITRPPEGNSVILLSLFPFADVSNTSTGKLFCGTFQLIITGIRKMAKKNMNFFIVAL